MENFTIDQWLLLGQTLAAFLTLATTVIIALVAQAYSRRSTQLQERFTRRTIALETDREIGANLLKLNFEIYANPELAQLYKNVRYKDDPESDVEFLRLLALARFRLSILYQVWRAQADGILPDALRRYDFDGYLSLTRRTNVRAFDRARTAEGFSEEFRTYVSNTLSRLEGVADIG